MSDWITGLHPLLGIIGRTAIVYLSLLIGIRVAGKREVGQMTPFDLTLILLLSCSCLYAAEAQHAAQIKPTIVLLVRHAEKIRVPASDDPALTAEGRKRAEDLARIAGQAGVKAVFATQYQRTRATAEPLAKKLGLPVQEVDAGKTQQLVDKILKEHTGETILVAGHSDTVPEIIEALGGGKLPNIPDDEFDNLYVVTVYAQRQAAVVRLKY